MNRKESPAIHAALLILGVSAQDDPATVRAAWRRLVRIYHPDVAAGNRKQAAVRLAEINAAYDLLRAAGRDPKGGAGAESRRRAEAERQAEAWRRAGAARRAEEERRAETERAAEAARKAEADRKEAAERRAEAARRARAASAADPAALMQRRDAARRAYASLAARARPAFDHCA